MLDTKFSGLEVTITFADGSSIKPWYEVANSDANKVLKIVADTQALLPAGAVMSWAVH
jgi:hypothetical protein